jgi:hypothetical protein
VDVQKLVTSLSEIRAPHSGIAEDLSTGNVTFCWVISDVLKGLGTSVFRVKQSRINKPRKLVASEDKSSTILWSFKNH